MDMWSCTRILNMYNKAANYVTPIRGIAFMVLLLGLVDNLTSPLQHALGGGSLNYSQTPLEIIIRVLFIFCGIFGLIGNGRTVRIRATVVSLPLLYLSIFYTIMLFKYDNNVFIGLIVLAGIPGLWTLLFGDRHDK